MAEIKMPQLGESVTEGTIAKWLKGPGDKINKYDPICEVITDKVNAEVPSDFEGVMAKVLVGEGETVPVGTVIAVIEEAGTGTEPTVSSPTEKPVIPVSPGRVRFSPAVMHLLQEHNLNPSLIKGTGAGGRITRKDVLAHISGSHVQKLPQVQAPSQVQEPPVVDQVVPASLNLAANAQTLDNGDLEVPVTPVRQTIAKRMAESKYTAPHAWTIVEADVTNLVKYREAVKDSFRQKEGISLTFLPFFIKAVVESLKEFPILNSTWAGDKIIIKKRINISIAVATDDALFVPVIKDADRMSILGLAQAIHDLARKARAGKLTPDDISGGTFTVNNTGAFGSILSQPIINSPQAAILSMESIVKRPVVLEENDAIAIRSMMNLCLSFDHRVLDGLVCGNFLAAVKQRLESFDGSSVNLY
ncbi:dihydrolipoamide acetyltransferase family protein [Effusibacillus lacus]|uniref:Dihydrolipoamide acetyltransferase component of pyruvate dehydrogenase complex n=1 Tax=Effusibacillus lacus TaxID=1348429 RepID=A0A292YSJ7_9BACL|nr:dihydrolipoamide acetyltransferase family protein [Effusibacillus lacus]TCS76348.1 branched-chain alpha-keto acid dehydrogenase E2 component [Effusibacillus lacus]GAX91891.1 branched-chain alpha-keto acid dehydrogenase subunit E2 [Effusibacillus lacus]